MTKDQEYLIRSSWAVIIPIAEQAGHLFYQRLFELAPSVKPMFTDDISAQQKKLMDMITYVVANLDKLNEIMHDIRALGLTHKGYGAKPEHYAIVGDCLIWTLKKGLGSDWNEELETAWTLAYGTLSQAMIEAQGN